MRPRLTQLRKDILALIEASEIPVDAQRVHSALPGANLATVYRALDYLCSENELDALQLSCSCGAQRYYTSSRRHVHFFHCEECHNFYEVPLHAVACEDNMVSKELGCRVKRHVLYFTGVCGKCMR
jgi:Fur family ferric uptake transcriptional regulator